jgi:hypothetical protein
VTAADAVQKGAAAGPVGAPALAEANSAYLRVCGQVFTMLARGGPEAFKAQVATLNDAIRATVQQVMMQAMHQQQQQQQPAAASAQTSSPAPVAGGKLSNFSKFTKQ